MRTARRLALLALTAATTVTVASSCSYTRPVVDRVNTDQYWAKSDFTDGDSWYYSTTVVEGAPNGWLYQGDGGFIVMERLKWEVTEDRLIGWRDYAAAPGTEIDSLEGGDDTFRGQPIAVFEINEHFDIRNEYDPLTGEQTNVISRNTERPWYEREYMHVNWGQNLVPSLNAHHSFVNQVPIGDQVSAAVDYQEIGDPKRYRFLRNERGELDYMEITMRTTFAPNINAIYGLYGPAHFIDTAPAVSDIRHSFMKVKDSDYIPLPYPASVVQLDENGEEIRNDDGIAKRVPIFDRFGYFTTWYRQSWDPDRGFTKASEQNFAIRYNVWERNRDSMGNPLPYADREPKPMHWYTNLTHPKQLLRGSQRVADEWNKVFKDMVFNARNLSAEELGREPVYASIDEVPDMFVLHENDCNPANVKRFLDNTTQAIRDLVRQDSKDYNFDGDIEKVIEAYEWANSYENHADIGTRQTLETQALSDLERICTALEFHTLEKPAEDYTGPGFTYQRDGDIRFNMINGIVEKALAPWLGVATILADPLTGEEIKSTANIGISAVDLSAFRANEAIKALNGEISLDDIIHGYDIEGYIRGKLRDSRLLMTYRPNQQLKDRMAQRITQLGLGNESREVSPDYDKARLSRLAGTHIEDLILSDETLMAYGMVDPLTLEQFDGDIEAATIDRASPLRNWDVNGPQTLDERFDRMGEMGMDPIEMIDQFALGAAMQYRHLTNERERFEKIREDLYVSTQLHEVGHTLGLRHNFEASSDALNYGRSFWEIQALDPDLDTALGQVDPSGEWYSTLTDCLTFQQQLRQQEGDPTLALTTQECLAQNQQMYSTIMEYNGHWTADFGGCESGCGLGLYDYQAIRFGYAQMLEKFNRPAQTRTEEEAKRWLFLNDWRDIPGGLVEDIDAIEDRSYFFYDWTNASTSQQLPENVVPYRWCADFYDTPSCNRWDWGPDSRYNTAYEEYTYYQRFFFTHFNRDRYWDIYGNGWRSAFNLDYGTMATYTQKMRWYAFYKAFDPDFTGSYAEEDLLATTVNGLNHIMHVLGHPGSGTYTTLPLGYVDGSTNVSPYDYADDDDRLVPSNIMRPFDYLGQCEAIYVANVDQTTNRPTGPAAGFNLVDVKLGDGRPFAIGSDPNWSEEWVINYVGTYFTKELAFSVLSSSAAWFPKVDGFTTDPRAYNISWYRLFPNEVGKVIHDFVTENYVDLGPVVDANGNLEYRDLIDPATGLAPDYTGYSRVSPTVAFNHQYYAALYSLALMSTPYDGQYDMSKAFIVAVEGAEDDFGLFEQLLSDPQTADKVVEFEHPITGRRIRAVDQGPNPVGASMVRRLNVLKDRYQVLDGCVEGTLDPATTPYCKCIETIRAQTSVTGELQLFCNDPYLETPGEGLCGEYDLRNRRDRAREIMDDMQDFIEDVRFIKNVFQY